MDNGRDAIFDPPSSILAAVSAHMSKNKPAGHMTAPPGARLNLAELDKNVNTITVY